MQFNIQIHWIRLSEGTSLVTSGYAPVKAKRAILWEASQKVAYDGLAKNMMFSNTTLWVPAKLTIERVINGDQNLLIKMEN